MSLPNLRNNQRSWMLILPFITALLTLLLALHSTRPVQADSINTTDFVTTWQTDLGSPGNSTITIGTYGFGYNYEVDWDNDGAFDEIGIAGSITHDFDTPGTRTIRIRGNFPRIFYDGFDANDAKKLIDINQWGNNHWLSMKSAFAGTSLGINNSGALSAIDAPDLSGVSTMSEMFSRASAFNSPIDSWNTASVTDMSSMFRRASSFNNPIDSWNTASVTDMSGMFSDAITFNQPIGSWDTSSVTNMQSIFNYASAFNQPLGNWNTASVTNMGGMFDASAFNQPLGGWNVSKVTQMVNMFNSSRLSMDNYDATLIGWAAQSGLRSGVSLGASGRKYCNATDSRQSLIEDYGWTITGDYECSVGIYWGPDLRLDSQTPAGTDLGSVGTNQNPGAIVFTLACSVQGLNDDLFTVSVDRLIAARSIVYVSNASNKYEVCVKATDSAGRTADHVFRVEVKAPVMAQQITKAVFSMDGDKKQMIVNGTSLFPGEYDYEIGDFIYNTGGQVLLNGTRVPVCAWPSETADEINELEGEGFATDGPICFSLFNENWDILPTFEQLTIWLPSGLDTTSEGRISIAGSPDYVFNKPASTVPATPTITVNGDKPLGTNPTIPTRPTFTGTAEPGATVSVEVRSDPVSCETTANTEGNWSCTLPQDLAPGEHTVRVTVTLPSGDTQELGPYTVNVDEAGSAPTIDSTTKPDAGVPGVPNTGIGFSSEAMTIVSGLLLVTGAIVAIASLRLSRSKN